MKTFRYKLLYIAALSTTFCVSNAQTNFEGGNIDQAANWSNSTPNISNLGTVTTDGQLRNVTDFVVTQSSGNILDTFGSARALSRGSWDLLGGSLGANDNGGLKTFEGHILTVNGGTLQAGSKGGLLIEASTLNMFSGNLSVTNGGNLQLTDSSSAFVEGGTISVSGNFNLFSSTLTLGGTAAGTFTATDYINTLGTINIQSGTLVELAFTAADDWAETEWNAGRLVFNGSSSGDLGVTWAEATNSTLGLGGGEFFNYDVPSNALVLIPEPSSFALIVFAFLTILALRRRKS